MKTYSTVDRVNISREELKDMYYRELSNSNSDIKLYIDTPFCMRSCKFCNCRPYVTKCGSDEYKRYYEYLLDMINFFSDLLHKHTPSDIYFGGGTPSFIDSNTLSELLSSIPKIEQVRNKTIECHPGLLSDKKIDILNTYKFNYFSIGIQTFDINNLKSQNRIGIDIELLKAKVDKLKLNGAVVNIDLLTFMNDVSNRELDILDSDLDLCKYVMPDIITAYFNFYKLNTIHNSNNELISLDYDTYKWVREYRRRILRFIRNNNYSTDVSFRELLSKDNITNNLLYSPLIYTNTKRVPHNYDCSGFPHFSDKQIALGIGGYKTHVCYGHIRRQFNYEMKLTDDGVLIQALV